MLNVKNLANGKGMEITVFLQGHMESQDCMLNKIAQ